jgi:uncharacterized protein
MAGEQNVDTAKQAYDAFSAGDAEAAMARIADDVEWITPGNSAISGTVHGKQEIGALRAQLAELQDLPAALVLRRGPCRRAHAGHR